MYKMYIRDQRWERKEKRRKKKRKREREKRKARQATKLIGKNVSNTLHVVIAYCSINGDLPICVFSITINDVLMCAYMSVHSLCDMKKRGIIIYMIKQEKLLQAGKVLSNNCTAQIKYVYWYNAGLLWQ